MSGTYVFEGNATWDARSGRTAHLGHAGHNGRSGRPGGMSWATLGLAIDDQATDPADVPRRHFDVSVFGTAALGCAQVRKGDRVRVISRAAPRREVWVDANGRDQESWRIIAVTVEELPPLRPEEAQANVVARLLAATPEEVLGPTAVLE